MNSSFAVVADTNANHVPDFLEHGNIKIKYCAEHLLPSIKAALIAAAGVVCAFIGLIAGARSALGALLAI